MHVDELQPVQRRKKIDNFIEHTCHSEETLNGKKMTKDFCTANQLPVI